MSKLQKYRLVDEMGPSRLSRALAQIRSYWAGPLTTNSPELARLWGSPSVSAGVPISETTALNYAAVWSAVNLIASDVASLPLVLYKRSPDGGKEKFQSHPLYRLLHDRPNPETTSVNFRKALQAHVLTWGNGYAEIERDGADRPIALWLLTPDRVNPFRQTPNAALLYRVQNEGGGETIFEQRNILHVPGLGWDGVQGYSVISKARESIGLGVASEKFGSTFFGNGATFGGVLSYKGPKPPELSDKNYVEALKAKHQGVDRAHQLLAIYNDATYSRMGIPPNDAQFLETRQFQITEVARWFNLPPHKIGDLTRATFSNIEQQSIDYYTTTMRPWLTVWEQELAFKLISASEQNIQMIEHIADAILRGDTAGRTSAYAGQFNIGAVTPNEIRAAENRNAVVGGDRAFVMRNMIPLDRIDEVIDAEIAKATAVQAPTLPTPKVPTGTRELEIAIEERDLARKVAQEAEDLRDLALNDLQTAEGKTAATATDLEAERAGRARDVERLTSEAVSLGGSLQAAVADLDIVRAKHESLETEHRRVCGEKATVTLERDILSEQARELCTQQDELTIQIDGLSASLTAMTAERDGLAATVATHEAVAVELRGQIATLTEDKQAGVADVVAVRVELAAAHMQLADATEGRRVAEALAAERGTAVEQAERRLSDVRVAVREVVVDRLRWLVEREAERARGAQGSPEKLLKWVDSFYAIHDELCRKVLRPSVRAWMVCTGQTTPIETVLDTVVTEHIEQSTRALRSVASEHDVETLAPALEKMLRRWESDRAETVADRVCREAA